MNTDLENIQTWNRIAEHYEKQFMDLSLYGHSYELFLEKLTTSKLKILDLGCGPRIIASALLKKKEGLEITGLDSSPEMIKRASKNVPGPIFKCMDVRMLDDLQEQFSGIIGVFILPYLSIEDCTKLISDCSKVLFPGGILYLSFVEGDYEDSTWQDDGKGNRLFFYYHSSEFFSKLLRKYFFHIVETFEINYTSKKGSLQVHTIFISRKTKRNE